MSLPAPQSVLADNGLPLGWRGRPRFVILDTCFGAGCFFFDTWRAWSDDPERPGKLHYLAIAATLPKLESSPLAVRMGAVWPPAVAGFHRLYLDGERVVLDLMIGPVDTCLRQIEAQVDAFYGPKSDWEGALARLAAPGHARISHISSRGSQQRRCAPEQRKAIVIGAGLAGAAACERLAARGWDITLIERHDAPAQEASGNLAGIFKPQLSKDDNPASRLTRAAFLFALQQWQRLGGVGTAFAGARCGVLQLARDAAHAQVQRDIGALWNYPPGYAKWLDSGPAGALAGWPAPHGGWLFEAGGWANPAGVCEAMLAACGARLERRFSCAVSELRRDAGQWQVFDAGGRAIAQAPTVILACASAATALAQAAALPLGTVRGQVTHLGVGALPELALVLCGDAYVTPSSNGVACVGATYDTHSDPLLRADSQRENLQKIRAMMGQDAAGADAAEPPLAGRVGFRCVAPDRLPLVGALPDYAQSGAVERLRDVPRWPGLYGLLGYASRGLIWAPLAAELLAAQLEGEPLPLEASLVRALDPARFLLKDGRRRANLKHNQ